MLHYELEGPADSLVGGSPGPDLRPRGDAVHSDTISALKKLRCDLARYRSGGRSWPSIMLERGVWACCEYRFGHWVREEVRGPARPLLRILSKAWHLVIEMTTGISIDPRARIGAGLYIGHFGCIIVGGGVKMGENCNISQGVTIGVAGRDGRRGSPVIDHEVYIAPGAKVIGAISVGRGAAIGANAVVTKDLPANAVAVGVPATVVSLTGTRGLITNFA